MKHESSSYHLSFFFFFLLLLLFCVCFFSCFPLLSKKVIILHLNEINIPFET